MTREGRRVTSADVARASGVSRATVSYVLNNDPRQTIPAETRERVLQAAKQLGYQPFAPARILRAGYSQIVLAVLPYEQVDPGHARDLRDLEAALAERGYSLIWYVGLHNAAHTHPAANLTPAVIVVFSYKLDDELSGFLKGFNAPVVWLGSPLFGKPVGSLQVDYLAQRGWRRMVFAAPNRADIQELAQQRLAGVQERCAELGLEPPLVQEIPLARENARAAVGELLTKLSPPFAICCYNDEVACAALAGLTDATIPVPQSVAVIGCDDIPLAQLSIPALTTITAVQHDQDQLRDVMVANIIAASRGEDLQEYPPEPPHRN